MPNENYLKGIVCPKCGHKDSFEIMCNTLCSVYNDQIKDENEFEWDDASHCQCHGCEYGAPLSHFRTENQS